MGAPMSNVLQLPATLRMKNQQKVKAIRAKIALLPPGMRPAWEQGLREGLRQFRSPVAVAGGPETPAYPDAKVVAAKAEADWDLALANWLDDAYGAVSDRVEQLGDKAANVVAPAFAGALAPFVLLALGLGVAIYLAKR